MPVPPCLVPIPIIQAFRAYHRETHEVLVARSTIEFGFDVKQEAVYRSWYWGCFHSIPPPLFVVASRVVRPTLFVF